MIQGSGIGYQKACQFDKEGAAIGQAKKRQPEKKETIVNNAKIARHSNDLQKTLPRLSTNCVDRIGTSSGIKGQRTVRSLDREVYTLMDFHYVSVNRVQFKSLELQANNTRYANSMQLYIYNFVNKKYC